MVAEGEFTTLPDYGAIGIDIYNIGFTSAEYEVTVSESDWAPSSELLSVIVEGVPYIGSQGTIEGLSAGTEYSAYLYYKEECVTEAWFVTASAGIEVSGVSFTEFSYYIYIESESEDFEFSDERLTVVIEDTEGEYEPMFLIGMEATAEGLLPGTDYKATLYYDDAELDFIEFTTLNAEAEFTEGITSVAYSINCDSEDVYPEYFTISIGDREVNGGSGQIERLEAGTEYFAQLNYCGVFVKDLYFTTEAVSISVTQRGITELMFQITVDGQNYNESLFTVSVDLPTHTQEVNGTAGSLQGLQAGEEYYAAVYYGGVAVTGGFLSPAGVDVELYANNNSLTYGIIVTGENSVYDESLFTVEIMLPTHGARHSGITGTEYDLYPGTEGQVNVYYDGAFVRSDDFAIPEEGEVTLDIARVTSDSALLQISSAEGSASVSDLTAVYFKRGSTEKTAVRISANGAIIRDLTPDTPYVVQVYKGDECISEKSFKTASDATGN